MRLITFSKGGSERVGVRLGESVVDLSVADPSLPRTLLGLIETGALPYVFGVVPLAVSVALVALELLIAVVQAYVFALLASLYLNDAINLH